MGYLRSKGVIGGEDYTLPVEVPRWLGERGEGVLSVGFFSRSPCPFHNV